MNIREAAKKAGVSENTIRQWLFQGKIKLVGYCHADHRDRGKICTYSLNCRLRQQQPFGYEQILDTLEDGAFTVDKEAGILYTNQALRHLLNGDGTTALQAVVDEHWRRIMGGEKYEQIIAIAGTRYRMALAPIREQQKIIGALGHLQRIEDMWSV